MGKYYFNKRTFFIQVWYALATLLVIVALLFSMARALTPWVSRYKTQIEHYASQQLGMPVKIGKIQAGWYYFEPVIHLSHVGVLKNLNSEQTIVTIEDVGVGIDLFSSLLHWSLQPGVLIISQVSVTLDPSLLSDQPFSFEPLANWILNRKKVLLQDVTVEWKNDNPFQSGKTGLMGLMNQPSFLIDNIYLKLKKKIYAYHVEINADWFDKSNHLNSSQYSSINASIDFAGNSADEKDINQLKGDFFVSVDNLNMLEWKNRTHFFPNIQLKQGESDIQWYGNFDQGEITQNLDVTTHDLSLDYPNVFSNLLDFSNIHLNMEWGEKNQQKQVNINQFFIENAQISASTQGSLTWGKEASEPYVELNAQFALQDLGKITRYLPDKIMGEKLKTWLNHSIVDGNSTAGKMTLRGFLSDFPFDNMPEDKGLFLVDSDWNKFTLDYKEGWPVAKEMNAHIIFKNRDLMADIYDGMIDQLPLQSIKANILGMGLHQEVLNIQGHLQTDAENSRHFVLHSPLKEKLSSFQHMIISGPAIFDIDIQIPLYEGNNNNLVNGKIDFLGNQFILQEWWNLHFNHFKGWLTYNQDGIIDSQLKASLFSYPLKMNMKNVKKPKQATEVDISGTLGIDAVQKIFHVFVFEFMKGATPYQAKLILTPSPNDHDTLTLKANLKGVAVDLPAPFGKKATQTTPFSLLLAFSDKAETQLSIHYANQVSIHLGYNKANKQYQFKHGKIHLGSIQKTFPKEKGLKIEGTLPEVSVSAWEPFLTRMIHEEKSPENNPERKDTILDFLESIQLNIGKLNVKGMIFDKMNIILSEQNDIWTAHIKSVQTAGDIEVPHHLSQGVKANLDYFYMDKIPPSPPLQRGGRVTPPLQKGGGVASPLGAVASGEAAMSFRPNDLPSLNLYIKNARYDKMNLGKMILLTERNAAENEFIIRQLNLQTPTSTLNLSGNWIMENGQTKSQLIGYLASNNVQATLADLDMPSVIQGKKGVVNFNLNWPDSFMNLKGAYLNGTANIQLNNGVITHLDKSTQEKVGLGKLVSLLSLQTLPKRLTLDFSDLSAKGLSFDILKGSFILKKGKMTTKDTYLDGSVAYVSMSGIIDLGQKNYDLILAVAPHATSSLPLIATIAGGPIVGLAAFAANTLINQGMKHMSMYTYKVQGPWKNPVVKSLDASDKKKR